MPRSHCAAKKASCVCLAALSDVADGAGSAACRQAAGAAAISAASSRCLNMEGSPEWKSGSLARGVVDAGVPKVGRLRPDRSTCGSGRGPGRAEEHTSELQSLMRISYAVFCLKKTNIHT